VRGPSNPLAEAHHTLVLAAARLDIASATAAGLRALGLHLTHVCCEDSVRSFGPARGSKIGDMTLQVHSRRQGQQFASIMPVLRAPGFADCSARLPLAALRVRVGNQRGEPLRAVGLHEYLGDLRAHLSRPDSWPGTGGSLLTARDEHVEVRAQACCLPVPRGGLAGFLPVVCPPRSWPGAPAVLAIVATRDGTSATVVDHRRDRTSISRQNGQYLLHNRDGQRVTLTVGDASLPGSEHGAVLLIQVPLRQPPLPPDPYAGWDCIPMEPTPGVHAELPFVVNPRALTGPVVEVDGLALERDESRPICVTVNFYRPVTTLELDDDTLVELGALIERVYSDTGVVCSLVDAGER